MAFDIDLRDLHYFEAIAELEHVGRAAARLNRTQPAISSCIRRLEDSVGAPLFEKSGRGIRLTEAGRTLLKWAQRVRLDVEGARDELGALRHGISGLVRIGLVPTAAHFLLPAVANQLIDEAPEVRLRTVVGLVASLKPLLLAGEIDLMIASERTAEEGLVSHLVSEDTIVVAASLHHPIFNKKPALKDLIDYRWALQPPGAPTRDWLDNAFEANHLPRPYVQVESTMLLALPALIAESKLLSFISRHHLRKKLAGNQLKEVPIRELTMTRRLVMTYRENAYLSPATRRLIELLLARAKESPT